MVEVVLEKHECECMYCPHYIFSNEEDDWHKCECGERWR